MPENVSRRGGRRHPDQNVYGRAAVQGQSFQENIEYVGIYARKRILRNLEKRGLVRFAAALGRWRNECCHGRRNRRDRFRACDLAPCGGNRRPSCRALALGLSNLVPYKDGYLCGCKSESYQVGLDDGFQAAMAVMDVTIRATICRDIGGDEQRILTAKTQHDKVTFKHILLPVCLSANRYQDKVYRFMVNARTVEVQGELPWSVSKIAAAVAAVATIGCVILNLLKDFQ